LTDPKKPRLLKKHRPTFANMPFIGQLLPNGKRFVSMRMKFVAVMLITSVAVLVTALAAIPLALRIFHTQHTQPDRVEERLDGYVRDFAAYVAEEKITSDNTEAVIDWTRRHRSVYLTIFNDADDYFGAAGGELWEGEEQPDMDPFFDKLLSEEGSVSSSTGTESNMYIVLFANGIHSIAVVDYSLSTGTDTIIVVGVMSSILIFFLVIMLYYHNQTRAIVSLSREVETVSGGDLTAAIGSDRGDEIGQLACDVGAMRDTILRKMEEEQRAWQANSDLLTSMTHDIRTPLTTLLGYMELLSADTETLTPEQKDYIKVCTTKAEQIKGLSDKLFLYFWAFNRVEPETELETVEAALLFEQLVAEYIPAMEAAGIHIVTDLTAIEPADTVRIRAESIRRVSDNVFDNLVKYADRGEPVTVSAAREGGILKMTVRNAISPKSDKTSSTRIGVKTCVNMMKTMNGSFETSEHDGYFSATMTLPIE
jgi:signal transduction histidine kinase